MKTMKAKKGRQPSEDKKVRLVVFIHGSKVEIMGGKTKAQITIAKHFNTLTNEIRTF
jgi:hypothetical protein